jgi:hypothetical protein
VDPSGSGDEDNADNDEIGIVIGALGVDGNAYLLEDCSIKAGPATWGKVATDAFERHDADVIVGEGNFGGDMVRATIHTARKNTNFKKVTASRGKVVRAEPFSALYEQGKVRHVGIMAKLEDELCAFTTNGYQGAARQTALMRRSGCWPSCSRRSSRDRRARSPSASAAATAAPARGWGRIHRMNYDPQQFPGPPFQVRISVHGYLVPTTVYADALCTQAHAQPVVIGADGEMPPIFLETHVARLYDLAIEDRNGTTLAKFTKLGSAEVSREIAAEF